ncbi:hypothetical protein IM538_21470 [Cytobacillus suaedae]|nr:hypothetical protein IM538_21470 [Cytobacillus suaedae]
MSKKKNNSQINEVKNTLEENPPTIIGGYKRQGWAVKALDKTSNADIEVEKGGLVTAKAILEAKDGTFYPAFLSINTKKKGQIVDAFFLSETEDQFNLIPLQLAQEYIGKEPTDLMPFKYKTLEKIEGDQYQVNWPDFS